MSKCMLSNTTANSLEMLTDSFSTISAHSNNDFCSYTVSLKQILHDENLINEINTTHWEIKLILFSLISVFINLVNFLPVPNSPEYLI